jgi:hypothetical protein
MSFLVGLWPLIWHQFAGYGLIVGLLAAAYFSPVFKKDFVYAAIIVGVTLFVYQYGVHDEAKRVAVQEQVVNKKVDQAVQTSKSAKVRHAKDPWNNKKY